MAENISLAAVFVMMMVSTPVVASGRYTNTVVLSQPLNDQANQTPNNNMVLRLPLGIKIALPTSILTFIFLVYGVFKCIRIKCEVSVKHRRENGGTTHNTGIQLSERVNHETDDPEQSGSVDS